MEIYSEFLLKPRKLRRRPPLDGPSATILCSCGWDSHVPSGPNLLFIPSDVICPCCGNLVLAVNKVTL